MAAKGGRKANGRGTVIIRREESAEPGHHGGAWKVAYADFVTAMMAFFLLMWLLNATTDQQKRGIANYFSPNNLLSNSNSGSGLPFGGKSPFEDGQMVSNLGSVQVISGPNQVAENVEPDRSTTPARPDAVKNGDNPIAMGVTNDATAPGPASPRPDGGPSKQGGASASASAQPDGGGPPQPTAAPAAAATEAQKSAQSAVAAEKAAFATAAEQIRAAVQGDPSLAGLVRQLAVDVTPQGLRIQMLDEERQPMFATGSATPNDRARALILKITPILAKLPEDVSIAGYTDAAPYRGTGHSNWELSADRANATRRLLVDSGLPDSRVRSVTANADRDLLLPADPLAAANRRIAVLVLSQAGESAGRTPQMPPVSVAPAGAAPVVPVAPQSALGR